MRSDPERTGALVMAGIICPPLPVSLNNYMLVTLQSGEVFAIILLIAIIAIIGYSIGKGFWENGEDENESPIPEGTDADEEEENEGDEITGQDGVDTGPQDPPRPHLPPGPDRTAEPSNGDTESSDISERIIHAPERQVKAKFLRVSEGDNSLEDAEKVGESDLARDVEKADESDPVQDAQKAKD